MSRSSGLTFLVDFDTLTSVSLLIQFLKKKSAILTWDNEIHCFTADDGMTRIPLDMDCDDYVTRIPLDVDCGESDPYQVIYDLFKSRKIVSFDFKIPMAERTMCFNCDLDLKNKIMITIFGDSVLLDDGMIDFNWYYNFWKELFVGKFRIAGVEFSVFET